MSTHTTYEASLADATWSADPDDTHFQDPFVDIDEWRDAPVRHRYVHGGWRGDATRFSFYFPAPDRYQGRFFQHVTPVPQSENLAQEYTGEHGKIAFATSSGAYFVETNGGGPDAADPFSGVDPTIGAYRANAAAARLSRHVARAVYDIDARPFGYLYGGSGGAYRTMGSSENTEGVWDGFVPYVPGTAMSIPNVFSVRMHAQRILRDKYPDIVDAYDVGGDPESLDLTAEEAATLEEVTQMGFPIRSWFGWETMGMHAFSVLYPGVMAADPTFGDDFWTQPGYLGTEPGSSIHTDRVQLTTTISELVDETTSVNGALTAGGVDESYLHSVDSTTASALRLSDTPGGWILGALLHVRTGTAAGTSLRVASVDANLVSLEPGQDAAIGDLAPGDEVTLDNSSFLAVQTYHRHQVPTPDFQVWDQFRDQDGSPLYPQRPLLLGPIFTAGAAGGVPTGQMTGKVIIVACLLDREAFPWQAAWHRTNIAAHFGADVDDRLRLWFVDNALHGDEDPQEFPTRTVNYEGALEAALRQLAAWVEDGVAPAADTSHTVIDGQVIVPDSAAERRGVQPVAVITVNNESATTVRPGDAVHVRIDAEAPAPGVIVQISADLTGSGTRGEPITFRPAAHVTLDRVITFAEPGTYMISTHIVGQVEGDSSIPHARVQNIARARITVQH